MNLIQRLKPWAIALLIVLAYGIVGTMDYEDAVVAEAYRASQISSTSE